MELFMDNIIYHYCSRAAFLGIVKSKSLWATDLLKMNDPHEVSQGKAIIEKLFSEYFPDSKLIDNRSLFDTSDDLFLSSSLSRNGDLLSQWRSYAVDGSGFSIGIDTNVLLRTNLNPYKSGTPLDVSGFGGVPEFSISEVLYDKEQFIENVRFILENHSKSYGVPFLKGRSGLLDSDFFLFSKLLEMNCLLKSDFYKDEQEVRVFKTKNRDRLDVNRKSPIFGKYDFVDFIDSNYGIKAYAPVFLTSDSGDETAVKKVIIGPKNGSDLKDVELFLKLNGFQFVEVSSSAGAYR